MATKRTGGDFRNDGGRLHAGSRTPRRLRQSMEAYAFVAPAFLLILAFSLFPLFFSGYISLFRWRIRQGTFVGLANYGTAFATVFNVVLLLAGVAAIFLALRLAASSGARRGRPLRRAFGWALLAAGLLAGLLAASRIFFQGDRDMLDSLRVTVWYSVGTVPVQLALGLLLAVLLDRKFRFRQAYRVLFLVPYIVPSVASAAVFERIFSLRPEALANQLLLLVHARPLQWLYEPAGLFHLLFGIGPSPAALASATAPTSAGGMALSYLATWEQGPSLALVSVMLYNYWVFVGYYALIFLNGLSQIPRQIYDAAEADGAGRMTIFTRITLPLVSPSTYFLALVGVIGTFKAFTHVYVLRNTAAQGSIDPMSVYVFFTFFRRSQFGYAEALSIVLLAIVLALTVLQRKVGEARVFYGD